VAARYIGTEQPAKYQLSDKSMSARAAAQIIKDECLLDGNPTMNLASFVTTW
jgi:glutamate decarboxylase